MERIVTLKTCRSEYDIRCASEYSITVEEFIDILSRCPKDSKVVFSNDNGYTYGEIGYSTIRVKEVETFEEEKEREEREQIEADLEEKNRCIRFITKRVNENEGELILPNNGILLHTCCEDKQDALMVIELTTKIDGKLYGNTNWGLINLEDTIIELSDWYTLEDFVGN